MTEDSTTHPETKTSDLNVFGNNSSGLSAGYYSWSHDDVFQLLSWMLENMPESFKHLNKVNITAITNGAFPNHLRIKCSNVKNKLSNLRRRYLVLKQKLDKVNNIGNTAVMEKVQKAILSDLPYFDLIDTLMLQVDTPKQPAHPPISPSDYHCVSMSRIDPGQDSNSINKRHQPRNTYTTIDGNLTFPPSPLLQHPQTQDHQSVSSNFQLTKSLPPSPHAIIYSKPNPPSRVRHSPYTPPGESLPKLHKQNSEGHICSIPKPFVTHPKSRIPGSSTDSLHLSQNNHTSVYGQLPSSVYGEDPECTTQNLDDKQKETSFAIQHQKDLSASISRTMAEQSASSSTSPIETDRKGSLSINLEEQNRQVFQYEVKRKLDIEYFRAKEELALRRYEVEERIKMEQAINSLKSQKLQAELEKAKAELERININSNMASLDLETKRLQLDLLKKQYEESNQ